MNHLTESVNSTNPIDSEDEHMNEENFASLQPWERGSERMDEHVDEQTEPLDGEFQPGSEAWIRARWGKAAQIPIDLDDVIGRLADQQTHLANHIDRRWDDLDPRQLARLLSTYGGNAVRLGRLLRDRAPIGGKMSEALLETSPDTDEKVESFMQEVLGIEPSDRDDDEPDPDAPPIYIDDVIADLDRVQTRLGRHLDGLWQDPDAGHLDRLLVAYSRNASRLSQLMRYRADIYGPPPSAQQIDMDVALYIAGQILGINPLGEP